VSTRPELRAEPREVSGKKVSTLRRAGKLPAVIYGSGQPSEQIQLDAREFDTFRRRVGRNALVDLRVGNGRARPVLVHALQEHPVQRHVIHADFLVVRMTEEMTVDVAIATVGESHAVEKQGGTLLHLRETVQVRALPGDLPSQIELDISGLDSFDTVLHVSDLQVPAKVAVLTDPAEPLARVQAPRLTEEPTIVEEVPAEDGAEPAEVGDQADESGDEASS
jgi:large subunit ribosomal protein L25